MPTYDAYTLSLKALVSLPMLTGGGGVYLYLYIACHTRKHLTYNQIGILQKEASLFLASCLQREIKALNISHNTQIVTFIQRWAF